METWIAQVISGGSSGIATTLIVLYFTQRENKAQIKEIKKDQAKILEDIESNKDDIIELKAESRVNEERFKNINEAMDRIEKGIGEIKSKLDNRN